MSSRRPCVALGVAVLGVALLTAGCWRAGPIDGPGATTGANITGDQVPNDKAAIALQAFSRSLPVMVESDSTTHTVRLGTYGLDLQYHWKLFDGPGATSIGATADNVGGGASIVQSNHDALPRMDAFYFDTTSNTLRHAPVITGNPVNLETLDGPGSGGGGRTTDASGQFANPSWVTGTVLNVLYAAVHQTNPGATVRLRHASIDLANPQATWTFEDVDGPGNVASGSVGGVGQNASVAFSGDFEHAFYLDSITFRLRHAKYDGSTWTVEDLDGPGVGGGAGRTSDHVGNGSTAAVATADGHLHVFYVDNTTSRLRHGDFDGSTWSFSDLDGPGVPGGAGRVNQFVGGSVTVAQNAPAPLIDVIYTNQQTLSVRHAQWSGTAWRFETIDGAGNLTAGGTTDQVGFPTFLGAVTQQMNAAVYGGVGSSILHVYTGDKTNGAFREACTLGAGIFAPANCAN